MTELDPNSGVAKFSVFDQRLCRQFFDSTRDYQHFINIYLIIRDLLYKNQLEGDKREPSPFRLPDAIDPKKLYRYFCNREVVRAVVKNRVGGNQKDKVAIVVSALSEWQLFNDLVKVSSKLQAKSIYKILKKINAAFKGYFTKIKEGDLDARPPKPRKLAKVHRGTIPVDQNCFSFKRKNIVGVNITDKMVNVQLKHKSVLDLVGSFSNVKSLELICSPNEIILAIHYEKPNPVNIERSKIDKYAGLDLGICNIASIAVLDQTTPSILVDGAALIQFNAKNNRLISKAKSELDLMPKELNGESNDSRMAIKKRIEKLYSTRKKFFVNQFHKLSNRILEDLKKYEVTCLFVSKNLADAKNSKTQSLGKVNNQKFYQIPIVKLIDYLTLKGSRYGIEIKCIDEAYTSKCSVLSGDICKAQAIRNESNKEKKEIQSNVLNAKRLKRSLFKDIKFNEVIHADLNAAFNHIKVGLGLPRDGLNWLSEMLWKLVNPIKKILHTNAPRCFLDQKIVF